MSDIRGDWHLLEVLRKTTLADVPDAHWEIICKQVVDANGIKNLSGQARQIVFDGVEKAKSFGGNRSEAGRYAASVRWQNQGKSERSADTPEKTLADIARKRKMWEQHLADARAGKSDAYNGSGAVSVIEGVLERLGRAEARAKAKLAGNQSETGADAGGAATGPDKRTASAIASPSLSSLASAIRADLRAQGKKVPFAAAPYLDALESLDSIKDKYYEDSGKSVVAYLLSNLGTYKGPNAKAIKAELKRRLKEGDPSPQSETSEDKKGGKLFPVMPAPTKGATEAARRGKEGDFKQIGRGKDGPSKPIGRAPENNPSPDDYKAMSERSADKKGEPKTDPKSMADRLDDDKYDGRWMDLPLPKWYAPRSTLGGTRAKAPQWVVAPDVRDQVREPKGANRKEWLKSPAGKKALNRARREHFKRMENDPKYRRDYLEEQEWMYNAYYNP